MSAQQPPLIALSDAPRADPHAGRVAAIHAGTAVGVFAEVLGIVTVTAALYGHTDPALLLGWSGCMAATVLLRLALSLRGQNHSGPDPMRRSAENTVTAVWCIAGFGWGIAIALFFPLDGVAREALILLVVCAMVALSLEVATSSRRATYAFAMPATMIPAIALLATGEPARIALAALLCVFLVFVWYGFARRHRGYETALVTRLHNNQRLNALAASERSLRASIQEERSIVESALVGIAIVRDDRLVRCNRRMEQLLGYQRNGLDGLSTATIYPSNADWRAATRTVNAHVAAAGAYTEERAFRHRHGGEVWCRYRVQSMDAQRPEQGSTWVFEDMTEQKIAAKQSSHSDNHVASAASAAGARLVDAISCIADAFALFDRDDRLVLCNRRYIESMSGHPTLDSLHGKTFEELVVTSIANGEPLPVAFKRDPPAWVKLLVTKHRNPDTEDFVYEAGDGRWWQVRERRTSDGGIVTMKSDITHLKRSEEEVRHLAHHDPLTGLPNRRLLDDRLGQALNMALRSGLGVAVMLIDLDRFKTINDSYGHEVGDRVLQMVGRRLKATVRRVDTVARQGGDEFVVVLPDLRRAADTARVATKILQQLGKPIVIDRQSCTVGASIGISVFPTDGADAETLLRAADVAMYRAKSTGSGAEFVTIPPQQQELDLHWSGPALPAGHGAMRKIGDESNEARSLRQAR